MKEEPKELTTLDRIKMLLGAEWIGGPFGGSYQLPPEYFRRTPVNKPKPKDDKKR